MSVSRRTRFLALGLSLSSALGLLLLLPLALGAQTARADVIRVCPTCAHTSIWGAVADAYAGDTVLVEAGVYYEGHRLLPRMGVTVTSESGADQTTIIMVSTNSLFDFTGVEGEPRRVLSGFTIVAHPDVPTDRGGAIYIGNRSKPLIAQNVFSDCVALRRGGAICIEEDLTQPLITGNRFVGCAVRGDGSIGGGAIFIQDAMPIITGNVFLENHCDKAGGALYIYRYKELPRQATVADNEFYNNSAGKSGGAIYAVESKPCIRGNTFLGNSGSGGAGLYLNQCNDAVLEGNTIADNRVIGTDEFSTGGGLAVVNTARANLDGNFIRQNQAWKGDGLYIENAAGSAFSVSNNVLGDNGQCELMIKNAAPLVTNNTFLGTTPPGERVGIDLIGVATKPRVLNNIVMGQGYGIRGNESPIPFLSHNALYQNALANYWGVDVSATDLHVDPQLVDAHSGDWHLRAASPLIDAGLNSAAPPHDADGDPRPLDGNGDGIAAVDIGADEYRALERTPTTTATPVATPTTTRIPTEIATHAPTEEPTASPTASSTPEATPTATAAKTGTGAPSGTPTREASPTHIPGFTPTYTPTPRCLRQGNVWNDEFEDSALPLWQVDLAAGYARFQASVMELGVQTAQDRFPLLWARLPFPAADWALEVRFRYGSPTAYGSAIGVGSAAYDGLRYPEGTTPPGDMEDVLSVMQTSTEFRIRLLGRISWSKPAPDTTWHVMHLSREGTLYRLGLDGRDIGSVSSSEVTARNLYIGSALITRSTGAWTPMQIDYVRLEACTVWEAECLWLPLILRGR